MQSLCIYLFLPKRKCELTETLKKLRKRVGNYGKIELLFVVPYLSGIDYDGKSDLKQNIVTKRHKLADETEAKLKKPYLYIIWQSTKV